MTLQFETDGLEADVEANSLGFEIKQRKCNSSNASFFSLATALKIESYF